MTSWPIKFRLTSFFITLGVTLTEFALVAIPVGLALWLCNVASAGRVATIAILLATIFSLSISIPTHLWPRRPETRTITRRVR
ncbi:MAG TPA: hypothetical protein VMA09_10645 [Candidatus Binataceae bacterium]|nr:hypothetical protein [Candidatus Binataceae bacterium]